MNKLISFLIVNYKTESYTIKLIQSIEENLSEIDYEILVFDNSPEESKELYSLNNERLFIFNSKENIGFVKANNYLFKKSHGKILVLINNDVLLIDNSLLKLIKFIQESNNIGAVGPKLLNSDGTYQVSFYKFPDLKSSFKELILLTKKDPYQYKSDVNQIQFCDVIKGACVCLKREIIQDDYIFDENFEMFSEEVDLCLRLKKRGLKNVYFPQTQVIHFGGASSNINEEVLKYISYNYFKSKINLFKKHYPKFDYNILRFLVFLSLIERIILFTFILRFKQVRVFSHTFIKLFVTKKR